MRTEATAELPPALRTSDGRVRRVGLELEFSGLGIDVISDIVERTLGGEVRRVSDYEHEVVDTALGDFRIELDFAYLKRAAREHARDDELRLVRLSDEMIGAVAERIVPFEIVTPPVPMDRIGELVPLCEGLREAGALGTRHSPVYAFGLHMNPELPALDAATVVAYLKAFLCLYDWLVQASEVDWSRRLTPYVQAFPHDYVRRVVDRRYHPDMATLIDDYLEVNPDRNRALDMLPLFAHVDEPRVRAVVDDPRVKSRPTLHYRLPNCDIDEPGWDVRRPWSHWLQVERLANERRRLELMCRGYAKYLDNPVGRMFKPWAEACERWLPGAG